MLGLVNGCSAANRNAWVRLGFGTSSCQQQGYDQDHQHAWARFGLVNSAEKADQIQGERQHHAIT
jgi:hypothetical protein